LFLWGGLAEEPQGPQPKPDLSDAQLESLIIVWPWARSALVGGPPVFAVDACHLKGTKGFLSQVSMRMARRNVSLVMMWNPTEDAAAYTKLFGALGTILDSATMKRMSIISDRGKGLASAVDAFRELHDVVLQHHPDFPHLFRNVFTNYPALKLKGDSEMLVWDVMYAKTPKERVQAEKKFHEAFMTTLGASK